MQSELTTSLVPIRVAATRVGVPAVWLKAEAKANRVPVLRAGKRLLINVDELRKALSERMQKACVVDA